MYSRKEAWIKMQGNVPYEQWDGKMHCVRTDTAMTFRANLTGGFFSAYTFTLVLEGWLTIIYNGKELTLNPDDLYVYSPGMPVTILSASENYSGICLLVDEFQTLETDTVREMIRITYLPIVRLQEPIITLSREMADSLASRGRNHPLPPKRQPAQRGDPSTSLCHLSAGHAECNRAVGGSWYDA